MAISPDITVAAVVERNGEFLVVEERIRHRLVINQPAGHVEDRETLLAAVVRETLEETAYAFKPLALLGTYLWRNPANGLSTMRFAFVGEVTAHDPMRALDYPVVRALWLHADALRSMPQRLRSPLVLRTIDDYMSGRRLPLDSVACLDLETAATVYAVQV
jgi:8-oxo-dGTP pyrophosphatase MutT (NUDIX family)